MQFAALASTVGLWKPVLVGSSVVECVMILNEVTVPLGYIKAEAILWHYNILPLTLAQELPKLLQDLRLQELCRPCQQRQCHC